MVISGGNFKPDTLKPKEVVSLLLDDEELEKKCTYLTFFLLPTHECFWSPTSETRRGLWPFTRTEPKDVFRRKH